MMIEGFFCDGNFKKLNIRYELYIIKFNKIYKKTSVNVYFSIL